MQYESQTPRRMPPPVFCSSCGAGVTSTMAFCAVCGAASPAATFDGTLNLGATVEEALPDDAWRTFGGTTSNRLLPPEASPWCASCGAGLSRTANFCRICGESASEDLVPVPQPAPELQNVPRPVRHISLAYLDDVPDADLAPPFHESVDDRDAPVAPAPVAREPRDARPSDTPSVAVPGTVIFALLALGIAVLTHLLAPHAIPGYSAAEFDLKVQIRALEWLVGGVLIALVGLLLKR